MTSYLLPAFADYQRAYVAAEQNSLDCDQDPASLWRAALQELIAATPAADATDAAIQIILAAEDALMDQAHGHPITDLATRHLVQAARFLLALGAPTLDPAYAQRLGLNH
ncbi:MAG: hypothetical protein DCC73_11600 [Proteobacteria bacterium]|nr:MAG: hypothetical protein DCC73_11600 [Pseudomonadota bacterium]